MFLYVGHGLLFRSDGGSWVQTRWEPLLCVLHHGPFVGIFCLWDAKILCVKLLKWKCPSFVISVCRMQMQTACYDCEPRRPRRRFTKDFRIISSFFLMELKRLIYCQIRFDDFINYNNRLSMWLLVSSHETSCGSAL